MNFWEAQRKAKGRTSLYITIFILLTLGIALLIEFVLRYLSKEKYIQPMPFLGLVFLGITFLVAGFYYLTYRSQGGSYVAKALGAKPVTRASTNLAELQLLNTVEEMAVASGLKTPQVFILESKEINAFAAGVKPDNAAITVTRGALELLNRDELQGVIAHEFGHIYNADMQISMRLAAMVMGFMILFYLGIRLLEGAFLFGGRNKRGGNPTVLIALVFLIGGALTWFAGVILKSTVSRQREYLADACAVQFTRNPDGIANALRKIGKQQGVSDMPKSGMAYSHLYLNDLSAFSRLFATHPPLKKRIEAIEGKMYSGFSLK
ncbi:MAG: Protease HtpX [Chlamydiales bacterium]|nr:Protease HtpX [Chlamydiales bacterium]